MEFRCQDCGHLGSAAEVDERDGTVGAVCESCGTWSPLTDDGADGSTDESPEADDAAGDDEAPDQSIIKERLLPEPGEGPRCPKCATLLDDDADNCHRCGLNLERARAYDAGEAPWETPPSGLEGAHERSEELWEAARGDAGDPEAESLDPEQLEAYVDHVASSNLLEFGVRRLRFYLADHPDDEEALAALDDLASQLQSKVAVAEARVESDAEDFAEDVKLVQRVLPWVVFVLILVAIGIISVIMFG